MPTGIRSNQSVRSLPPFPEGWYFIGTRETVLRKQLVHQAWMGVNIVIWCDDDGSICVAESICPHMGSDLGPAAGGRVVDGRLVCPFHGFEFDAGGRCVATPSGAPARSAHLRVFETQEIDGLIFAWWGMHGRPSQWQLPDAPSDGGGWSGFQIRTVRFPGHPQETSENSVDMAHLSYVHGYGDVTSETPVSIVGPCLESRFGFTRNQKIAKIGSLCLRFSVVARVVGLGYSFAEFQEHSIGVDGHLWVLATPIDGTLIDLSIVSRVRQLHNPRRRIVGLGFLPRRMRAPIVNKLMADLQMSDVRQDVAIWSGKHYVPRPRLTRSDGEVMKYRAYCAQFYPDPLDCERPAS